MSGNHPPSNNSPPTTTSGAQSPATNVSMEFATKADIARIEAGQTQMLTTLQELVGQRASNASPSMEFATKADIARLEAGQAKILAMLQNLLDQRASSSSSFRDSAFSASSRGSPDYVEASTDTSDVVQSTEEEAVSTKEASGGESSAGDEAVTITGTAEIEDSDDKEVVSVTNIAEVEHLGKEDIIASVEIEAQSPDAVTTEIAEIDQGARDTTESHTAATILSAPQAELVTKQLTTSHDNTEFDHAARDTAIAQTAARNAFPTLIEAIQKADPQQIYVHITPFLPLCIEGTDPIERSKALALVYNTFKHAELQDVIFRLRVIPYEETDRVTYGITLARSLSCAVEFMLTSASKSAESFRNRFKAFRAELNLSASESPTMHDGATVLDDIVRTWSDRMEQAAIKASPTKVDDKHYAIYSTWKAERKSQAEAPKAKKALAAQDQSPSAQMPMKKSAKAPLQTQAQTSLALPAPDKMVIGVPPQPQSQAGQGFSTAPPQLHAPQSTTNVYMAPLQAHNTQQAGMAPSAPQLSQFTGKSNAQNTSLVPAGGNRTMSLSLRPAKKRVSNHKIQKQPDEIKKAKTFKKVAKRFFDQILQQRAAPIKSQVLQLTQQQIQHPVNTYMSQTIPGPPATTFGPPSSHYTVFPPISQNVGVGNAGPATFAPVLENSGSASTNTATRPKALRQRPLPSLLPGLHSPRQLLSSLGQLRHSARLRHLRSTLSQCLRSSSGAPAAAQNVAMTTATNNSQPSGPGQASSAVTYAPGNPVPTNMALADVMALPQVAVDSAPSNVWIGPQILAGGSTSFKPATFKPRGKPAVEATTSTAEGANDRKSTADGGATQHSYVQPAAASGYTALLSPNDLARLKQPYVMADPQLELKADQQATMLVDIYNSIKGAEDNLIKMDGDPQDGDVAFKLLCDVPQYCRGDFYTGFQPLTTAQCIVMAKHFETLALESFKEEIGIDNIDAGSKQTKYTQQLGAVGFGFVLLDVELFALYADKLRNGQPLPTWAEFEQEKEKLNGDYGKVA